MWALQVSISPVPRGNKLPTCGIDLLHAAIPAPGIMPRKLLQEPLHSRKVQTRIQLPVDESMVSVGPFVISLLTFTWRSSPSCGQNEPERLTAAVIIRIPIYGYMICHRWALCHVFPIGSLPDNLRPNYAMG